jgi:hypothetical protein
VILVAADGLGFDWAGTKVLAQKLLNLIDWLKFWR